MYKSSNFLLHAGLTPMRLHVANGFSAQQPCIQNCHAFFGFSQFDGAVQVMIWPFREFEQLWASLIDNFSRHKLSVAIRLFNLVIDRTLHIGPVGLLLVAVTILLPTLPVEGANRWRCC